MNDTCWAQLGIEPTTERNDITEAYQRKLHAIHAAEGSDVQLEMLEKAYQRALLLASSEEQVPEQPLQQQMSERVMQPEETQKSTQSRTTLHAAVWFVVLAAVVILAAKPFDNSNEQEQPTVAQVNWEEDLLKCNNIATAEPTEDFEICKSLAEEGWQDAQLKVAWAYTQDSDYKDWQQAYDWLVEIGDQNRHANLLAHVILFVLGDDDEQRLNGEKRIRKMANVRFAPAEAYLATLFALNLNQIERDANILWLLESAYEKDPSLISVFEMAQIHANGLHTRVNLERARKFISDYANSDVPHSINNAVWYLATLANNTLYQPEWIVERALMIAEHDDPDEQYSFIDTLAAAYAANGDFDKAVAAQQHAIAKINDTSLSDEQAESQRTAFLERLELYLVGDPVIYDDLVIDEQTFFDGLKSDIEDLLLDYLNITIEAPAGYLVDQTDASADE